MAFRCLLAVTSLLVAITASGAVGAADDISRIPRIGFRNVARAAATGLCARIADAIAEREHVKFDSFESADAILAVRSIAPEAFPKRLGSLKDLMDRLPEGGGACKDGLLDPDAAVLVYEKRTDGTLLRVLNHPVAECGLWGGSLICSGLVYSPGRLRVRFIRGSIKQGLAQITRGFGLTVESSEIHYPQGTLDAGNVEAFNRDPDDPKLPADYTATYVVHIEPRQEEPWATILNRLPLVDDAHRTPERVAAVDASRIFQRDEDINRLKRSPTASVVLPLPGAQTRSLDFLKEWFEARGGKLTLLKRDEMHVLLRVDRLRSEVISHERYWEYLKVNLILVDDQPKLRMYLMSDGYYAPGVGSNVPPDDSFLDMEHSYYKNLSEYTEALATRIENRLRGQP